MERAVANCRTALFVVLGVQVGLCAWVLSTRLGFPSDIEWMTGTVLDGIERARAGKPTYAAPNEGWIPFLYPPLYTWLGALLGGSALACRLLSVASVLVQTAMAAKMTKDLGAPRAGSAIAALLVIACFSYVGFFYDLERSDTLFGAFVMTGAALLVAPRRSWSAAAAGAIFGLGLLTKQQAIFFLGGAFVGLLLADRRRWRDPLVLAIAFAVVTAPIFIFENARTNGWFFYYVIALPRSHGLMKSLAAGFLRDDVLDGFALVGATLVVPFVARSRGAIIVASMLVAGFFAAMSSRLHIGGWFNVRAPWTSFAAVGAAFLATRGRNSGQLAWLVALMGQVVLWLYDPRTVATNASHRGAVDLLRTKVAELETRGDVLLPSRGHLTKTRHFHVAALADVQRKEGHVPADLLQALHRRAYVAVIDDIRAPAQPADPTWPPTELDDFDDARAELFASYFVAERLPAASTPMRAPGNPSWVLLPRVRPFDTANNPRARERAGVEMRLASGIDGKRRPVPAGEIEALAAVEIP